MCSFFILFACIKYNSYLRMWVNVGQQKADSQMMQEGVSAPFCFCGRITLTGKASRVLLVHTALCLNHLYKEIAATPDWQLSRQQK